VRVAACVAVCCSVVAVCVVVNSSKLPSDGGDLSSGLTTCVLQCVLQCVAKCVAVVFEQIAIRWMGCG